MHSVSPFLWRTAQSVYDLPPPAELPKMIFPLVYIRVPATKLRKIIATQRHKWQRTRPRPQPLLTLASLEEASSPRRRRSTSDDCSNRSSARTTSQNALEPVAVRTLLGYLAV